MKTCYLAGPYTHPDPFIREMRYQKLLKAEYNLLKKGYCVISPINMCHVLSNKYGLSFGYEYWQERDRTLISKCDEVIVMMMDGYKESIGVTDEVEFALANRIPVTFLTEEVLLA